MELTGIIRLSAKTLPLSTNHRTTIFLRVPGLAVAQTGQNPRVD